MQKKKIWHIVITIIIIINIVLTAYILVGLNNTTDSDMKYTIYIGTNDKDTYSQLISTDESKQMVNNICAEYLEEGYTIVDGEGYWIDDTGISTDEDTIILILVNADEEVVYDIADQIIEDLNQSAVLIEKDSIQKDLYEGKQ